MKLKYIITGIDCPNCAAKLATQMSAIDGIDSAKINFLTEKLTVETSLDEATAYDALSKVAKAFSKDIKIEK
ncbi:MAG: cation transporter [Clostridia bacterium]|nr:cation transporter [Clostridia bacterium]